MERENRYLVLKLKDIDNALTETELSILILLSQKVDHYRTEIGKEWLNAVVVESDWPEFEPTWKAIEDRISPPKKSEGFRCFPHI